MATVLFGADASLAVLPLMLFHQMQLMVCAVIAKRRSRDTPEPDPGREPGGESVSGARSAGASRTAAGTATRSG
jgi:sodium/bile acid cotransporter 7